MLLVVDVGNSNVALGVFDGDHLRATWRVATDVHRTVDEYAVIVSSLLPWAGISVDSVDHAIIGSVVPPMVTTFVGVCERYFNLTPLIVAAGVRTGIRILYEHPRDVGADRIANAVGAVHVYGAPALVVDIGTATTIDAVSASGDFLGGVIAPGMGIAAEALFEHAAKLPRVELLRPKSAIGRNTVAAMQSGIIFGYVGLVDGIVERVRRELGGEARVIATGGLAEIIARESTTIDVVDQNVTLYGLRCIYNLNRTPA